ncbi:hypothetical protein LOTGIDRAFT_162660 [Lottia gigantea]|uniref:Fibrinogen C-terminal domain-containing protein n=1 Tax=Lottia gigantea TaxID=225164 RepID=V4BTS9_LOTGI|nr:hypothetical protein LOTGIDRAFT_162660 [Lottia gigantea]ESO92354.1 hypothetical protein LOTGIDRAFT_162660 [Lottia gigantea]
MAYRQFFLKLFVILCYTRALYATVDLRKFTTCKDHYASCRIREQWTAVKVFQCYFYCGRNYWCRALTIKPIAGGVTCTFHEGIFDVNCKSFPFQKNYNYKLLLKNEVYESPDDNGCKNDATYNSGNCQCLKGFTGTYCERYVRDCREAKEAGVTLILYQVVHVMIKPTGNNYAFEALCNYYGYIAILIRHAQGYDVAFNRSFEEYKYPFGMINNYWSGLENIYAVLNQGETFKLQIFCHDFTTGTMFSVYYNAFHVTSSPNMYQMSVGSILVDPGNEGSDGLGENNNDIPFCTYDKPCNGYPNNINGGWWYVNGLQKYALTNPKSTVLFKYRHADFSADSVSVSLERL